MGPAARLLTVPARTLAVLVLGTLVACSGTGGTGGPTSTTGGEPSATTEANAPAPDAIRVTASSTGAVVVLEGMLATPCHEITWDAGAIDADGVVPITLTVTAPTDRLCAQVLTPYRIEISAAELPPGARSIAVGDRVVPLTQPGSTDG